MLPWCALSTVLQVRMLSTDAGGVYKGRRDNCDTGYVVTASFEFVEQTGEGDAAEVTPTGMQGRSVAIGEYAPVPGNPQRLTTKFKKMRLEPASQEPADLQRWLDTLLEANPGMVRWFTDCHVAVKAHACVYVQLAGCSGCFSSKLSYACSPAAAVSTWPRTDGQA
eukprot:GHRQ01033083.1.p1 GENE.GHRQ01033083.1~~GHRQ01033083.1.p1  ORF type:complete len:166 (+),score=37.61 GHRQ01033083.1:513-1010(+)